MCSTGSTPNQTLLKQRRGRDHRTSTGQEILEEINITDRESCRSVTDYELERETTISQIFCPCRLVGDARSKLIEEGASDTSWRRDLTEVT